MPRSVQEILDRADDLAKRSEDCETSPNDEVFAEEYLFRPAVLARGRTEEAVGSFPASDPRSDWPGPPS